MGYDMLDSEVVRNARDRLHSVGVASYRVEVAGAGSPELQLDGATYIGEREIQHGVDLYLNEVGSASD